MENDAEEQMREYHRGVLYRAELERTTDWSRVGGILGRKGQQVAAEFFLTWLQSKDGSSTILRILEHDRGRDILETLDASVGLPFEKALTPEELAFLDAIDATAWARVYPNRPETFQAPSHVEQRVCPKRFCDRAKMRQTWSRFSF